MTAHPLDTLLDAAHAGDTIVIPPGWGQGRATFGGVVAGALIARVLGELDADQNTVRSMTTNFVAPALAGPARLTVELLRRGRSATQAEARLIQPDDDGADVVRAVTLVTLGAERSSSVAFAPAPATVSSSAPFDTLDAIPFIDGITPEFIARVDLRPASGGHPFSGRESGDLTGFMRFREPTAQFSLAHLVALIDAWPPAAGQMLAEPAPMSTMTWTVEFVADVLSEPVAPWWYDVVTDAAAHGYAHCAARISDGRGDVVAFSRQTVALFG